MSSLCSPIRNTLQTRLEGALPIVKTVNRIKSLFISFLFFSLKIFPFLLHSHASYPAITVALSEVGLTSSSLKPVLREHRVAAML